MNTILKNSSNAFALDDLYLVDNLFDKDGNTVPMHDNSLFDNSLFELFDYYFPDTNADKENEQKPILAFDHKVQHSSDNISTGKLTFDDTSEMAETVEKTNILEASIYDFGPPITEIPSVHLNQDCLYTDTQDIMPSALTFAPVEKSFHEIPATMDKAVNNMLHQVSPVLSGITASPEKHIEPLSLPSYHHEFAGEDQKIKTWNLPMQALEAPEETRFPYSPSTEKSLSKSELIAWKKMKTPYGECCILGPNDIVCGRGGRSNHHKANGRLLETMRDRKTLLKYKNATRGVKTAMTKEIVSSLKLTGGRFLVRLNKSEPWMEAKDAVARVKISHMFRDQLTKMEA